jgi:hypothetical protein
LDNTAIIAKLIVLVNSILTITVNTCPTRSMPSLRSCVRSSRGPSRNEVAVVGAPAEGPKRFAGLQNGNAQKRVPAQVHSIPQVSDIYVNSYNSRVCEIFMKPNMYNGF